MATAQKYYYSPFLARQRLSDELLSITLLSISMCTVYWLVGFDWPKAVFNDDQAAACPETIANYVSAVLFALWIRLK